MAVVSIEEHPQRLLQAALRYAGEGIPVFQVHWLENGVCSCSKGVLCGQPGKHPASKRGFKDATLDRATIEKLWKRNPHANIGLSVGDASLVVVDVDPRNGGDSTLGLIEQEYDDFPVTRTINTGGGGTHYYYRLPDGVRAQSGKAGDGIDLKTTGGYVIAPPSLHVSGHRYEQETCAPETIAEAPQWLVDYVTRCPAAVRAASEQIDPQQSILGAAFSASAMVIKSLGPDRVAVECPWNHEHTTGTPGDSSTIVFSPVEKGGLGWFHCSHSHCVGRKQRDAWNALNPRALAATRKIFRLPADWEPPDESSRLLPLPEDAPSRIKKRVDTELTADSEDASAGESGATATSPMTAEWRKLLRYDGKRRLTKDPGNLALVLSNHDEWKGILSMDVLKGELMWTRMPPLGEHFGIRPGLPWKDGDHVVINHWFSFFQQMSPGRDAVEFAARIAGEQNAIDPIKDYLLSLKWDGVPRAADWLGKYMHAVDLEWASVAGRKWLISAVARVLDPGCQADHTLILESSQGTGKSTAWRVLARQKEWFFEGEMRIGEKDTDLKVLGHWIIEFGELDAFQGAGVHKLKRWLTQLADTLRVPYARTLITRPRRCVFTGSTNEVAYLQDPTGARRFWPVKCADRFADSKGLEFVADQLWAEAVELYQSKQQWHITDAREQELARAQQQQRTTRDPWADYLMDRLDSMGRDWCTSHDGLERLDVPRDRWDGKSSQRVSNILHAAGWVLEVSQGARVWLRQGSEANGRQQFKAAKSGGVPPDF